MPYPNNLEIYDSKLVILQAEALYNTAIKRKRFYEIRLKKASISFNKNKKKILKFGHIIKVGTQITDCRGKIPDTTYEKYYRGDYEKFVNEINSAVKSLWWHIEIEKEMAACEKEKKVDKKLCAFITLKKNYEEYLLDIDISLKDCNPKAYEEESNLYKKNLRVIDNRIKELLDKRIKRGLLFWLKRVFKASKIKTPVSETDLGKI